MSTSEPTWASGRAMGVAQLVGAGILLACVVAMLAGDSVSWERWLSVVFAFGAGGMVQEAACIFRRR